MFLAGLQQFLGVTGDVIPGEPRVRSVRGQGQRFTVMDSSADPMIRLDHVTKEFPGGTVAVDDLDMAIGRGEICAPRRAFRLRQDDHHADDQLADRPHRGTVLVGGSTSPAST